MKEVVVVIIHLVVLTSHEWLVPLRWSISQASQKLPGMIRVTLRTIQAAGVTPQEGTIPFSQARLPYPRNLILPLIEQATLRCVQSVLRRPWERSPSFCLHFRTVSFLAAQTQIGVMGRQEQATSFVRTEEVRGR